mmetsp:Transcript_13957/g.45028  ORF Transcript_13957/g.45028 Transcript_13957/m.45028 type:complete len:270 (+) Transcript_13957:21-830(+)
MCGARGAKRGGAAASAGSCRRARGEDPRDARGVSAPGRRGLSRAPGSGPGRHCPIGSVAGAAAVRLLIAAAAAARRLELREDVLHERRARVVVAGGVALGVAHVELLERAVVEDGGVALRAHVAELGRHLVRGHREAHGLGELAAGVREHGHEALGLDVHLVGPGLHDRRVVDAVDEDLVDSLGLELVLLAHVPGNLRAGSGRRERPGEAQDDRFFAGEARGHVDRVEGELLHEDRVGGHRIADGDVGHRRRARAGARRREGRGSGEER